MESSLVKKRIDLLNYILDKLNLYLTLIIFIFGIIGNILNCLVLSQQTFRSNLCSLYFLSSSIVNLFSILISFTTKILASWHIDPTHTNDWSCKFRIFIVFTSRTMAIWLIIVGYYHLNIDVLLAFIASDMPFYLYTLAGGTVFPRAFLELLHIIVRKKNKNVK